MGRRGRKRRAKRIVPEWMIVREGFIQNIVMDPFGDGRMCRCIPLFPSYDHARSFIDEEYWAMGARPCQIGSMRPELDGSKETLNTIIAGASLLDRCEYAAVMEGTAGDGDFQWRFIDIRPETLGLSADRDLA